ncbi:MAG: acyltransferase family protein, partial [Candidatus Paceibacterota bacterium]
MNQEKVSVSKKKINFYISYIKGIALIGIILIHLIDWSNMSLSLGGQIIKELFHVGLFLFVLTAGSVIVIAYKNRSMRQTVERLLYRGAQLLFFYYLYNIVKLFIFDFTTEPFYKSFIDGGTFTISNILMFHSFSVPITILGVYVLFLIISPLLLLMHKSARYPTSSIVALILGILAINYLTVIPSFSTPVINFLYANGNVLFPFAMWLVPFLIGFFLAQVGFEKQRKNIFIVGGVLTAVFGFLLFSQQRSLFPSEYQFPLAPYYMAFSLFVMSLFLYLFRYLERMKTPLIKKILAAIRLLGDNTLHLYLYHWIVI